MAAAAAALWSPPHSPAPDKQTRREWMSDVIGAVFQPFRGIKRVRAAALGRRPRWDADFRVIDPERTLPRRSSHCDSKKTLTAIRRRSAADLSSSLNDADLFSSGIKAAFCRPLQMRGNLC